MNEIAKRKSAHSRGAFLNGSDPRGILVRDKRYPWYSTLKSHTCTLLYADPNMTVGRRNTVELEETSKAASFDNFSTFIIFNEGRNDSNKGNKTESELVITRSKTVNALLGTVFVGGAVSAAVLSVITSLWFLIILAFSSWGIYTLLHPSAGNFTPAFDTEGEIRIADHRISERVAATLAVHPKPEKLSALILEKFKVENYSSDTPHVGIAHWLRSVCNLYLLDPQYDVNLIPLVNSDLYEILDRMNDAERKRLTVGLKPAIVSANSAEVKRLAMEHLDMLESF